MCENVRKVFCERVTDVRSASASHLLSDHLTHHLNKMLQTVSLAFLRKRPRARTRGVMPRLLKRSWNDVGWHGLESLTFARLREHTAGWSLCAKDCKYDGINRNSRACARIHELHSWTHEELASLLWLLSSCCWTAFNQERLVGIPKLKGIHLRQPPKIKFHWLSMSHQSAWQSSELQNHSGSCKAKP